MKKFISTSIVLALASSLAWASQIFINGVGVEVRDFGNGVDVSSPLTIDGVYNVTSEIAAAANPADIAFKTNANVFTKPQTIECLSTNNIQKLSVVGSSSNRIAINIGPTNNTDLLHLDVLPNGNVARFFVDGQFGEGILIDDSGSTTTVKIVRSNFEIVDGGFKIGSGQEVSNIATTVEDDDFDLPSSGAVVDYVTAEAPFRVIDSWSDHDTRITNSDEPPVYWQGTIYELDTADQLVDSTTNTIGNGYNRHVVLNITHVVSTGAVVFTSTKVNESTGVTTAPFSETVNVSHAVGSTNVYIQSPSKLLNDVDYYTIGGGAFTADVYTCTYKDYWNRDFKVKNMRIGAFGRNATWDFNTELFIVHNDGSTTDLLSNRLDFASTDSALRLDAQTPGNGKISDFPDILIKGSEMEGIVINVTGSSPQGGPDDIQGWDMSLEIEVYP